MNIAKLGAFCFLDPLRGSALGPFARRVEDLGYSVLWVTEEDSPDDRGIVQRGDQAEAAPTLGTGQNIHAERRCINAAQVQAGAVDGTPASRGPAAGGGAGSTRPYTTTRARRRARGANRPWQISRLVSGRGVIAANRSRNSVARLLGRPASESGRLGHGDGAHGRGARAAGAC
jgi:hypothetical protein